MSYQVTEAMVQQYNSNIMLLSQQQQSRLRKAVRTESINAEFEYFDQIGPTEAQPKGGRHSDTPLMHTPHLRRKVSSSPYNWADMVDKTDKLRMLADPTSAYAQNAVMAFNRTMDRVIIESAFGPAFTGKEGKVVMPFPEKQVIGVNGSGTTPTGLTLDKLRLARKMFRRAEINENLRLFMAVSAEQLDNLLGTIEVQNSDYNTVKALVQGEVNSFMGFEFINTELLPWAANVRDCIAWAQDGILLAVAEDVTTKITERPDKNYSTQVYVEMDMGGTRMEEVKVIKVQCTEAAA